MDSKTSLLLVALRKIIIEMLATFEDYLDIPYDQSALYKRRTKR